MSSALLSREQDVPPGAIEPGDGTSPYPADLPQFGCDYNDESNHGQAVAFLSKIARESALVRGDYIKAAVTNEKVYRWGQEFQPLSTDIISNDIQTAVLAITDIQTREPFTIFIRPVQTRDKSPMFWIGPPVDAQVAALTGLPVGLGMMPITDEMGQPMVRQQADPMTGGIVETPAMQPIDPNSMQLQPLDEVTAWQVKKIAATGAFPTEWFVSVDDRLVADVYQTVFDLFWKECALDDFVRENLLKTNIYGYQTSYYSWDAQQKKHIVRDISIAQAFLDASAEGSNFELQNCPGFDVVMTLDQAKREYPQLAPLIEEIASPGTPKRVDSDTEFGVASNRQFEQRTVTFRIFWICNQMVPMLPKEAEEAGLVQKQPNPMTGQDEYFSNEPQGDDPTQPPQSPQWPMTTSIRQIATLAQTGRIVQDIRCEHWGVPMLLNVCIPIPSQPFGIGLPDKLKGMQQADIRLMGACVKYAETFANPGNAIPESVAQALKGGLKRTHIDPTESLIFPDNLIERFGKDAVIWFQPPALPPAVPDVMNMISARIDKTSGHSETLQGTAPSPNSSGRMVEALQAAATSQFGFQAQWTAKMVERLSNLMHYTHLWRLTIEDMMKIYSRLPQQIMQMVIDRGQAGRWDVQVDANAGVSGQTNRKLQRALTLMAATSPTGEPLLPLRMAREEANIDHEEASIAYRQEMMNSAPSPTEQQQQQQNKPQPSSNGSSNGNGNGHFGGRFS